MFHPTENFQPHSTGLLLRCARIVRGIPLTDLAKEIGITKSYLSRIETGKRRVTPELALRLARALSLPQSSETR